MIARYTRPEMGALWTDEHKFQTWLKVELAVAAAQAKSGEIPAREYGVIRRKARCDVARIREIEAEVRHDVIAFLTNVAENVGPAARYLHQGLTSSGGGYGAGGESGAGAGFAGGGGGQGPRGGGEGGAAARIHADDRPEPRHTCRADDVRVENAADV